MFAYYGRVGINRRKAEMEIAVAIRDANKAIEGATLGRLCAAGIVSLDVARYQCPRKGRYRLTRLIDRHGAGEGLPSLKRLLTADCPRLNSSGFYNQCGAYFPQVLNRADGQGFAVTVQDFMSDEGERPRREVDGQSGDSAQKT